MKILKKISVATVCTGITKQFFKTLSAETPVMRITGLARAYEVGTSQYGEFLKFKGEFHAIDLTSDDKTPAIGSVAFLPQPVDELLAAQIQEFGGSGPVEFAFDISVVPDPNTQVGFQYRVATLVESKASDPLAALQARISKVALPSPVKAAPQDEGKVEEAPAKAASGDQDKPKAAPKGK